MMSMKNTLKNHFSREEKKTTLSILKTFQQAKLRLGCQFKVSNATEMKLSSRSLFVVKCKLEGTMYVVVRSFRFHFV